MSGKAALLWSAALYLLLTLTYFLFAPGLSGGFVFDDAINLTRLARIAGESPAEAAIHYVLSGVSSTLGRPVSLATFAAQFYFWPHQPSGFLRVNLLLHLLNGILLFWLLVKISDLMQISPNRAMPLTLITTAIWLIHPLQISTVLYVVQRMTELSAMFTLAGLLAYTHGRKLSLHGSSSQANIWMSAGIGLGLLLGVLSKEDAILLPLYVLIIEFTLLRTLERPKNWNIWATVVLGVPLIALTAYLVSRFDSFLLSYTSRDFTLEERLLTESRILFDYLNKLFLPHPSAFGLLFDDYPVSRTFNDPVTTLPALLGIVALLTLGFSVAKRAPILSFGILWFFAAHLLESTFLPLELYFEHRNYIAIVGPLFALVYYLALALDHAYSRLISGAVSAGVLVFLLLIAFITYRGATLWGSPLLLAATWAAEKPESARAQHLYANRLLQYGFPDQAVATISKSAQKWEGDAMPLIASVEIGCYYPVPPPDSTSVAERLREADTGLNRTVNALERLVVSQETGMCHSVSPSVSKDFIEAALKNPFFEKKRRDMLILGGRASHLLGDTEIGMKYLEEAYEMRPHSRVAVELVIRYGEIGDLKKAIFYLNDAERNERIAFAQKWRYRKDRERLRTWILALQRKSAGESAASRQ